MALTVDKLINKERFTEDNLLQFLLYMPLGIVLLVVRMFLALVLWIASIVLPNKSAVRHMLSTLACWTFGVHVKVKGTRDPRCSMLVANYVSCLDSLACSHVFGTITLRKWKVPPFFASTLGIRNASQFVRKQHFAECPSKPVLLQPEGAPTNGKGLLKFTDWPFQLGNRVQPVAISVERGVTAVCVWRAGALRDALWFLSAPRTRYELRLLPPVPRDQRDHAAVADDVRASIAQALNIEQTEFNCSDLYGADMLSDTALLARQVKEVLPSVPMQRILRDLAATRSVDVTITNLLESASTSTASGSTSPLPGNSTTSASSSTVPGNSAFPGNARARQRSFHEKKAQMIADARRRYIEKHGLDVALNNC